VQEEQSVWDIYDDRVKKGGYICAPDPTLLKHSGNSAKLTAGPEQESITKADKQLQAPTGPAKPRTGYRSCAFTA
jgi:hypothetical protein